jgi:sulfite reductase (ferredoxin)
VPRENIEALVLELNAAGLHVEASSFWRGAVACTGTEFCKLALTETKGFARWLATELDERIPGFQEQLRINVTGCPNSCGQHWIADIGIEGKKIKVDGKMVDAYYFCIGGSVGQFASIARPVGYRCAATEVPDAIERLLRQFNENRVPGENLRQFFARHTNEDIRSILAGGYAASVERDTAAQGAVPLGVEN